MRVKLNVSSSVVSSCVPIYLKMWYSTSNISPSTHVKNQGLYMDRYMSFETHVSEISKKVMSMLIYINRISSYLDKKSRTIVVQSLVLSHINFCLKIWSTTNSSLIRHRNFKILQQELLSVELKTYAHVLPAYKDLNWLKIQQKYTYDVCVAMFKIINNVYPGWLYSFPTVHDISASVTRQQNNLVVPRSRSAKAVTTSHWTKDMNSFPANIMSAISQVTFKSKLKHFILCDMNCS